MSFVLFNGLKGNSQIRRLKVYGPLAGYAKLLIIGTSDPEHNERLHREGGL